MVEQWFSLVDDDSSGALEAHELAAALSVGAVGVGFGPKGLPGGMQDPAMYPLTASLGVVPMSQAVHLARHAHSHPQLQILSPIALQAAGVPCDESDIRELVRIIDVNHDGSVTWAEFQSFLLKVRAARPRSEVRAGLLGWRCMSHCLIRRSP